ncbi:MAG: hypothetical protein HYU51_15690 [Candidatus Rokubacteria bacterium]|nr:hypothetical protein [Candidatus Rokubacteria bacterium]
MRGLFKVFLVLAVVVYGGWTGMLALQHYMNLANLVNDTVERELPKLSGAGWQPVDRAYRIRESIVQSATQSGLPVDASAVVVSESAGVLAVRVRSYYTLARYEDKAVTVPISASRSFPVPTGGR